MVINLLILSKQKMVRSLGHAMPFVLHAMPFVLHAILLILHAMLFVLHAMLFVFPISISILDWILVIGGR